MRTPITALSAALLITACGGDPVSFSEPVGISLPVASKDVVSGAISADKNINTENGNPYGAFTATARARLGRDPSRVAVTSVTLVLLTATSTGVTALEQVFTGPVAVGFQCSGSGALYPVGQVTNPAGAGPVELTAAFDSGSLPDADRAAITQGQFKVVIAGTAANGFANASATADLKATFTFVAYE